MQEIKLIHYSLPTHGTGKIKDRQYHVFVNDRPIYFSSKKKLLAWLADLNRHLNQQAHALNRLIGEVQMEYRYYFFHFDQAERNVIENQLNSINHLMGLLVTRSQTVNANSFTYDRLHRIASTLLLVMSALSDNPMNQLATVQRYRLKTITSAIETVALAVDILPASE
jgi:hypothetical protein